jgi:putative N6-adenine-specific DNA methylase
MSLKKFDFFFVVAPGTEALAVQELEENWPFFLGPDLRPNIAGFPKVETHYGGLAFEADLGLGLQGHFWLKLPVRILVRLTSFFADEFFQLEKALQNAKLQEWLEKGTEIEFKIESQRSKLGQEKRVLEVATSVFSSEFKICEQANQKVYLRATENQWTLSLDGSGEPLYKRNWAVNKGEAPLRENLAATGWRLMTRDIPAAELQHVILYDPFVGSGTCLFEAALQNQPQTQRDFSFLHWKTAPGFMKLPQFLKNSKIRKEGFVGQLFGADIDPEMIKTTQKNLKAIQSWVPELRLGLTVRDFWNPGKVQINEAVGQKKIWVFTNPPFGQRIPWRQVQRQKWLQNLVESTDAVRIGFLYPQKSLEAIEFPDNYVLLSKTEFLHGGQAVDFVVLERKLL